jgi:hypothetical protein
MPAPGQPVPSELFEILKLLVTFIGGGFATALLATPVKNWWDERRLRTEQQQTRWAPLRRTARDLEERLAELAAIYAEQPPADRWDGYAYQLDDRRMEYPSKARDFCELYLLDGDREPITTFYDAKLPSPTLNRKNTDRVNKTWARLHELTYAASSFHKTAAYLAYAERVRTELEDGRLLLDPHARDRLLLLIRRVSQALNGKTGAGVVFEHQHLIGSNVWKDADSVVDLFAFYGMLLGPDWPKFTDLFRFYIGIQLKMKTEVDETRTALRELTQAVEGRFPRLTS